MLLHYRPLLLWVCLLWSPSAAALAPTVASRWLDVMQEAAGREVDLHGARPTVLSRMMAIWATAMFDAWAAYDDHAVGSRTFDQLRRPPAERTLANQEAAVSYAAFYALSYVFPEAQSFLAEQLQSFGLDPNLVSHDPAQPAGVARIVTDVLIAYRRDDGANQHGDALGTQAAPYSDYTFYQPLNTATTLLDPDRWQPITFTFADGRKVTPGFLTPHWYLVKPFVIESSAQFRPEPPPTTKTDDARLRRETAQVLAYNAGLTKEEKAVVEFMRDGPRSTGQSGHWLRFAQDVSKRDQHTLAQDVKLYFAVANVAFDAFISCWETKRYYDSSRPWTLIRHYYKGQRVTGWAGPGGGVKEMPAEEWHPYSPESFITPPFPGYTSGHATVSGAAAKTIELFTGSDSFGGIERRQHCALTETDGGAMVEIPLPTWTATAAMAARSRALGGYHIPVDNDVGLAVGQKLAQWSWPRYEAYFNGTARPRP